MGNTAVRRRHSGFAAGLATLAMMSGLALAPAQAVDKTKYIALGDSYAAGQGAGPYLDSCYRSDNTYSELADEAKAINLVVNEAGSGATTQIVVASQLDELNKSTDLVTITAGGNNIGFGNIVTYCGALAFGDTRAAEACAAATAYAEAQLSGPLYDDLVAMIKAVQDAAPNADVVVTGYPYLFDPIPPGATDALSLFIYQATDLADTLNATIEAAALATKTEYVDVADDFAGHGVNSATGDPWINLDLTKPLSPENFHPNAEGYEAYFTAIYSEGFYN
jgi:lysophospholipase L1-like esterase